MQQTDIERIRRQTALQAAIDNADRGVADADEIVADAEKFRAFLAGETTDRKGNS